MDELSFPFKFHQHFFIQIEGFYRLSKISYNLIITYYEILSNYSKSLNFWTHGQTDISGLPYCQCFIKLA